MTYEEINSLRNRKKRRFLIAFISAAIASALLSIGGCGSMIIANSKFDSKVDGPIKLAVRTNVEPGRACSLLSGALNYLDERGLKEGSTSFFYADPLDDLAIYYDRVQRATRDACQAADYMEMAREEASLLMLEARKALTIYGTVEGDLQKAPELVSAPSGLAFWPLPNALPLATSLAGLMMFILVVAWPFASDIAHSYASWAVERAVRAESEEG